MKLGNRSETILPFLTGPAVLDIGYAGQQNFEKATESSMWVHGAIRKTFHNVTGVDIDSDTVDWRHAMGFSDVFFQSAEDTDLGAEIDTIP